MYNSSNLRDEAIDYAQKAVAEDKARNYEKALCLYKNALMYFETYLKYEKNPKIKDVIRNKLVEYVRSAEDIQAMLLVAAKRSEEQIATKSNDDDDKLRAGLNSAIVTEKPNVTWNDVAGLDSAKQALKEAVILPVKCPQFFTGNRRPWRAFLLYGPPGTGKSYLAKAVATEAKSTFFSISSSDLVSKWMQGVGHNDDKVLVLAATNTPYALDQAIRRRFDKRIYIPLPDAKARKHMFKVHLGDTPHNLTDSDFEILARKTEGFSGSDVSVCVKDVLYEPIRKTTQDAMFFIKSCNGMWMPCGPKHPGAIQITFDELEEKGFGAQITPPPISKTDFDKVLAIQRPTVSKSDLRVHEIFTKEFGEKG